MTKAMKVGKPGKPRRSRRWFVSASGWGLDLGMGSGAQSNTGSKGKRSTPLGLAVKVNPQNISITGANFTHNTVYTYNPLAQIAQGTDELSRLGSTLKVHSMSIRGIWTSVGATNAANVKLARLMLVAHTSKYNPGVTFGSGLGTTDLFYTGGSLPYSAVNPRLAKVLCDTIVEFRPTTLTTTSELYYDQECVLHEPFEYQTGTVYGTAANLYFVLVPFEAGGTTGVTSTGTWNAEVIVTFED